MMAKLIERDPKKFMIEPNDPQHLLNKTNSQGWSPLYIAAKYGNLNVVKLLIENKANSQLKCRVKPTIFFEKTHLFRLIQITVKRNSR